MIEKHYIIREIQRSTTLIAMSGLLWVIITATLGMCLYGIARGQLHPFGIIAGFSLLAARLNWGLCRSGIQCRRRMIAAMGSHSRIH